MTDHLHLWEDDHMCYVCGEKNPEGLKLQFTVKDQTLETTLVAEKRHQGYKDVLHGGMLSMVLDEVMVLLPYRLFGTVVASGELTIKLLKPVPVGSRLHLRASFESDPTPGKRVYRIGATATVEDGTVVATAHSVCVRVR